MDHIDIETLYHLAELAEEEYPLGENDIMMMAHIAECKECYDKFCSLVSLMRVTSESGYIAVAEMFKIQKEKNNIKKPRKNIMAVISVAFQRVEDSMSVVLEQVEQEGDRFAFDVPLAVSARGVSKSGKTMQKKLEDADNECTFIVVDPVSCKLFVQLDIKNLEAESVSVYLISGSGKKIEVPVTRIGTLLKGTLDGVPAESLKLYIEGSGGQDF